jgi:hypothetical protein
MNDYVSPIDGHRHYGDAAREQCAVCRLEVDRARLLEALMATHAILGQPTSAPNGDYTIVPLLVAAKLAELRAVVNAAREWHRLHRAAEHQGHRLAARRTLFALLDQLDVSPEATGG